MIKTEKEHNTMTVYVMPADALGQAVLNNPVHKEGTTKIEIPYVGNIEQDTLHVISKNKDYPAYKVALAIAAGQIKIEDVRSAE